MENITELAIMDEEWDILIILDACRYEYFSRTYDKYLTGKLERRISPASCTPEWCEKSFSDYYPEVVYVSGNPYINSVRKIKEFAAKEHFPKIVNVWASGWNEEYGTVLPNEVNQAALKEIKSNTGNRFIIHYIQPHEPYISGKFCGKGFPVPFTVGPLMGLQGHQHGSWLEIATNYISYVLLKGNIVKNQWMLREKLRLPPASPMDSVRRKYGVSGLRQAYAQNLEIVLWYVAMLCQEVMTENPGVRIIITADHGELLGESGRYCHRRGLRNPIIREVPWFEVTCIKPLPTQAEMINEFGLSWAKSERENIKSKLRKLRDQTGLGQVE